MPLSSSAPVGQSTGIWGGCSEKKVNVCMHLGPSHLNWPGRMDKCKVTWLIFLFSETNKVQVTFSFFGELNEDDVMLKHVEELQLNLCANLKCKSSTELLYLSFRGGKHFAMVFLMPNCYLAQLKRSCVEVHRWLIDMKIVEIHVDREGQIFAANETLYARYSNSWSYME